MEYMSPHTAVCKYSNYINHDKLINAIRTQHMANQAQHLPHTYRPHAHCTHNPPPSFPHIHGHTVQYALFSYRQQSLNSSPPDTDINVKAALLFVQLPCVKLMHSIHSKVSNKHKIHSHDLLLCLSGSWNGKWLVTEGLWVGACKRLGQACVCVFVRVHVCVMRRGGGGGGKEKKKLVLCPRAPPPPH